MDNIVVMMVSFFIREMLDNGIVDAQEISKSFNENNKKAFKNMIIEYYKLQSITKSKSMKTITKLKKEIINLKNDIKISK